MTIDYEYSIILCNLLCVNIFILLLDVFFNERVYLLVVCDAIIFYSTYCDNFIVI
jgi:hypothetical protein